jgi:GNAT superfamily N-acetyltransferase
LSADPPTSSELVIRHAVPGDAEDLVVLYRQLDATAQPSARAIAAVLSEPSESDFFVVAELAGHLVATAQLVVFRNLVRAPLARGIIESVVVDQSVRRRGVGFRLMRFLMDLASDAGCALVSLSSRADREAAHEFYPSLGFTSHGVAYLFKPAGTSKLSGDVDRSDPGRDFVDD